jgi:hypothetical protein
LTPPFFVVGFQRSGTTLLRLMLDNHPDIAIPLDTVGLWARYETRLPSYGNLATPADRERLVRDLLAEERIRLWEVPLSAEGVLARVRTGTFPDIINAFHEAYAAARGKRVWGDKDPGNMLRIPQLNRWFPGCRIVHLVRDGRDACLSQIKQDFGFDDLLPCACAWREQVWWVRNLGQVLGDRFYELRYEDLVTTPEAELRRLCSFLGIDYAPGMLEYHREVERSVPDSKRHIWPLLNQPPRKDNAGRWKEQMSASVRVAFEKRAGDVLRDSGYEVLSGTLRGGQAAELGAFMRRGWLALQRRLPGSRSRPAAG